MSSALKVPDLPAKRQVSKREQLREVNEEANRILRDHRDGKITSDEAGARLGELKRRYASLFDRILAL